MPSDIFGLGLVYETQVESTWPELSEFGYFGGGEAPSDSCIIDRLDFSNETVSAPGNNLKGDRSELAAVSNSNYGYFGGGRDSGSPPYSCTIERLDFSTETVAAPGTLEQLLDNITTLAAVSNSNYGYFGGGNSWTFGSVSNFNRLDFSNETVSAPGYYLTQARSSLATVSNSNYGYFGGGDAPGAVCTIERLDFSNETVAAPGTYQLTEARNRLASVSNSNYGYFGGGYAPGSVCTIDRLDFSNETVSAPGNDLTQARRLLAAVSNSNYGYFAGGAPGVVCTIDRLDFSNETTSAPGNDLTQARNALAGLSTKPTTETVRKVRRGEFDASGLVYSNYGYFGGGNAPTGNVCIIDRLDFSNETTSAPGNDLTQARRYLAAVSNSNYGYFGGGLPGLNTIDRLDFSSETVAAPGKNLTQARSGLAAVSNSNYGYFGGGDASGQVCTIDRLDFSSETVAAPGTYQLTEARVYLTAVSNSNYGYFGGGRDILGPFAVCTIDRLDFSSETVAAPGNNLTEARNSLAAVSNSNYGYFGGGNGPQVCTIDRLDFSNETIQFPVTVGKLTEARSALAAVSNSNYGYFGGGYAPPFVCTIDRLDFSTETVAAPGISPGQLTEAREQLTGINIPLNQTRHVAPQAVVGVSTFFFSYGKPENTVSYGFGYFAGNNDTCIIDRLDFSTETVEAPGNCQLTQRRIALAAVSNSNYGYFAGGNAPPEVCTIDRLDFSNETVDVPGTLGQLTEARQDLTAVSSPRGYGYFAGGRDTPSTQTCLIDRLDFSSETVAAPGISPGQLTQARAYLAAVSNSNYGYFGGGYPPPSNISTIDRLDFYNETIQFPVTVGQLTEARRMLAAVSNSNYGYFAGGLAPGRVCTIDRLDFSSETVAAPGAYQLTQARNRMATVFSPQYGYFAGGQSPSSELNTIDRLDFSSETTSAPGNNLLTEKFRAAGTQVNYYQKVGIPISKAYGYFAGGEYTNCIIERLDFSNETTSLPGNNLSKSKGGASGVSSPRGYGYICGGTPGYDREIERLDFFNESVSKLVDDFLLGKSFAGEVSNSNYGYFAGGYLESNPSNIIERLDFSNDTIDASTSRQLSRPREKLASVSSSNYGYFAGGADPILSGVTCTIDRLDFSNETTSAPGNNLTQIRYQLAGVSNSNYGYFAGGSGNFSTRYCTIDRLDFSNETIAAPGNNLGEEKISYAAVSNSNYGYFSGGFNPIDDTCSIDRLDFSSETVLASCSGLKEKNSDHTAFSN